MKKRTVWLPIAIVLTLVIVAMIGLLVFMFIKGSDFYTMKQAEKDTVSDEGSLQEGEDISIPQEADQYAEGQSEEYETVALDDFSVSMKGGNGASAAGKAADSNDNQGVAATTEASGGMDDTSGYIIGGSDTRELTAADLDGLTAQELTYARNEIYARHGRVFKSAELQNYFDTKDWYTRNDSFDDHDLSAVEKTNAEFISQYQEDNALTYKVN